ncbi:MAG: DNA mismatch repair protein MutT [Kordiimonadales bacterium]|nr:MAG: DNA mismatch repair protein MutT [Kordiimonadales bacterium]
MSKNTLRIAAALITDDHGRTLLVRKHGTKAFMQAGGKIDAGETPCEALVRELFEELRITVGTNDLQPLGQHSAPAANEENCLVIADIFRVSLTATPTPAAEIAEILWYKEPGSDHVALAPLTRDCILPLLKQMQRS